MVAAGEGQSFPSYSSSAPELWLKLQRRYGRTIGGQGLESDETSLQRSFTEQSRHVFHAQMVMMSENIPGVTEKKERVT